VKESWINLSSEQQDELNEYSRQPGWRILSQGDLPSVFPDLLRAKIDSALAITAETSTGGTYLVFSALRVDSKYRAVDMQPLGLLFIRQALALQASSLIMAIGRAEQNRRRQSFGDKWTLSASATISMHGHLLVRRVAP